MTEQKAKKIYTDLSKILLKTKNIKIKNDGSVAETYTFNNLTFTFLFKNDKIKKIETKNIDKTIVYNVYKEVDSIA